MAEKSKQSEKKEEKQQKTSQRPPQKQEESEIYVRIAGYDIPGSRNLYSGLTRIKGISWSMSNAVCLLLKMPKSKKISELSKEEALKIESILKNLSSLPDYLKNRRFDFDTGESKHYLGSDLDIKKEFDIKRLKEIKSYRGIRHSAKLPVRGQRTRSHFRKKGKAMGIKQKKA